MNVIKNNHYKKQICLYWKNGNCGKGNDCLFAHGVNDIIKEECLNRLYCYNEDCRFKHPDKWNAFENKQECEFCIRGFCNKKNKKFNHIKAKYDISENIKDENSQVYEKKEIVFNENDFPELNKKIKNNNNKEMLYINKDINELNLLKKELYKNYKNLTSITDWSDDLEIDNNIKNLNIKYNELKQKINNENVDVFNNDLNLNIFDIESDIKNEEIEYEDKLPNIEITINGINIKENCKNDIIKKDGDQESINEDNILTLLNQMETFNKKTIIEIKTLLNKNYNDNGKIIKYKYQLNEIISKIHLLKLNYKDIF